jgi:hypothetical protein
MNPSLMHFINTFVTKGWVVTTQSEFTCSLEKKAESRRLSILLGGISLFVMIFASTLIGFIMLIGSFLLILINNLTKKSGTMNISVSQDGVVQVSSNIKKLNGIYHPSDGRKIKV